MRNIKGPFAGAENSKTSHRLIQALHVLATFLKATAQPGYLASKARYFGLFSIYATFVTALFVVATIGWDYAIDPAHAWQAIPWRLVEAASILLWGASLTWDVTAWYSRTTTVLVPLFVEGTFVHILSLLDHGNAYGVGGFVYFFVFLPFLTMAQPLLFSVLLLAAVALFPTVAQPLGLSAHLNMAIYNAYVWMVYVPVVMILLLFEYLTWQLYIYRNKMEAMAVTDSLTQIANRRHFLALASHRLSDGERRRRPVSLLFLDIDRFKSINDSYGHAVGDEVIKRVAKVIVQELREDDLIGRYGGEEFVVLLADTHAADAALIAERIRAAVSERVRIKAKTQGVSVSVGAATYTGQARDIDLDRLIHQADQALYAAKRTGRNTVVSFNDVYESQFQA